VARIGAVFCSLPLSIRFIPHIIQLVDATTTANAGAGVSTSITSSAAAAADTAALMRSRQRVLAVLIMVTCFMAVCSEESWSAWCEDLFLPLRHRSMYGVSFAS
jgi:hypothetical protein